MGLTSLEGMLHNFEDDKEEEGKVVCNKNDVY